MGVGSVYYVCSGISTQVLGLGDSSLYLAGPKCIWGGRAGLLRVEPHTYWVSVLSLTAICVPIPCLGKRF